MNPTEEARFMAQLEQVKAQRNPSEIYADLHEAVRRKHVLWMTGRTVQTGLPPDMKQLSLDRPVYDLTAVLDDSIRGDQEVWTRLNHFGVELAERGQLVVERCAIILGLILDDPPYRFWIEYVICIDPAMSEQTGDKGWLVHLFDRETDPATMRVNRLGPRRDHWCLSRAWLGTENWAQETSAQGKWGGTPPEDAEHWRHLMNMIFAMCGALAQQPELVESHSESFRQVNAGRAYGRLPPLAPVRRVLRLNRRVYVHSEPAAETGREMPFHFRRGTFRTYRHERYKNVRGQTQTISSTWVRRDRYTGELPAAPIYDVTP